MSLMTTKKMIGQEQTKEQDNPYQKDLTTLEYHWGVLPMK